MRKPVRPSEVINREKDEICEIIHDDMPVSQCFGIESWKINKAGIDALLNGEPLYFDVNDGEYAVILHYCE